jgi:hypothetical protein
LLQEFLAISTRITFDEVLQLRKFHLRDMNKKGEGGDGALMRTSLTRGTERMQRE